MGKRRSASTRATAASVRALCLDVDGVLTDGSLYYTEEGRVHRGFNIQDGLGIQAFRDAVGPVLVITGKDNPAVARRLAELGVPADHVAFGSRDKRADLLRLAAQIDVPVRAIAAMGDDLPDLPMLDACGYPMAPSNAAAEVREAARFVTKRPGGGGAVREAIEHILKRARLWSAVVEKYRSNRGDARRH
jgi:3-deoxy-D-manno-octulosonate 8-phosphate phosphatase (KDO 8-P phosphatase)